MKIVSVAERSDVMERAWEETIVTIPEYDHHGDVINAYWGRLNEERRELAWPQPGRDPGDA